VRVLFRRKPARLTLAFVRTKARPRQKRHFATLMNVQDAAKVVVQTRHVWGLMLLTGQILVKAGTIEENFF
jgi:hypothetical protein